MKKVTRFFSLLLAIAMVLAMNLGTLTVSADDEPTYTITINNTTTGYKYAAYQIFSGELSGTGTTDPADPYVLSNIEWGTGVSTTTTVDEKTLIQALQAITVSGEDGDGNAIEVKPFDGKTTAEEIAEVLSSSEYNTDDGELVQAFAEVVSKYLVSDNAVSSIEVKESEDEDAATKNYTITVSSPGYYLVQNAASSGSVVPTDGVYTRYILEVLGSTSVTPKSDKPTVEKKVDDENDSVADDEGSGVDGEDKTTWQDSADYDIGDTIPYQLTATLGTSTSDGGYAFLDDYSKYSITFTDTLSAGLTLPTDDDNNVTGITVTVKTGDTSTVIPVSYTNGSGETTTNYTVAKTAYSGTEDSDVYKGGTVLTISFTDVKSLVDEDGNSVAVDEGTTITVNYSATLNSSAVIGSAGNPNKVDLTYSNNPNNSSETGKTPEDKVTVFTFKLTVNKVDGDNNNLGGAAFDLYKLLSGSPSMTGGTTYYLKDSGDYTKTDDYTVEATSDAPEAPYYYMLSDGTNKIIYYYDGSDYYQLIASTTADNDVYTFTFTGLDDGTYKLVETTTPTGYNTISPVIFQIVSTHLDDESVDDTLTSVVIKNSAGEEISGTDGSFTIDTSYNISTNVVNNSGAELPSTGGMGTKIFYTLGGILVIGAGVLLIVKRRMRNA